MDTLKVSDFVKISKKTIDELNTLVSELEEIRDLYVSSVSEDLELLEHLKKQLSGKLIRFATLLSEVKAYKDGNHIYLGERRKQLKADTLNYLVNSGQMNLTNAKELVYGTEKYKTSLEFLQRLKKHFILYESIFETYSVMLNSIIQSISVFGKTINLNK